MTSLRPCCVESGGSEGSSIEARGSIRWHERAGVSAVAACQRRGSPPNEVGRRPELSCRRHGVLPLWPGGSRPLPPSPGRPRRAGATTRGSVEASERGCLFCRAAARDRSGGLATCSLEEVWRAAPCPPGCAVGAGAKTPCWRFTSCPTGTETAAAYPMARRRSLRPSLEGCSAHQALGEKSIRVQAGRNRNRQKSGAVTAPRAGSWAFAKRSGRHEDED